MEEYDRLDADYYDYYSTGLEGDVEFYVAEAQKAGSPVLELGCGTGRITFPIAQAGVSIVGLDLSPSMLEVARRKLAALDLEVQSRVKLVAGDMRDFSFDQRFNLIIIPYRAFMYMYTVEDQRQALTCIREHLTANGRLIFNIFDPRLDIIVGHFSPLGAAFKMVSEFIHPETGRRVVVWDTRQYDPETQMIIQYFIFEDLDESGVVVSKRYVPLNLRYFYRFEMQHLLELCGYRLEALYGDFQRGPFRYGGEQIWVARVHGSAER
jgi:ubiquinone/menaquinone biosynthesis C-methylase UbiE